jgi:hypothetical protein
VSPQIFSLSIGFSGRNFWERAGGPDLAVRVRIARAHHRPAVFEDLHMLNARVIAKFPKLISPSANDFLDRGHRHGS